MLKSAFNYWIANADTSSPVGLQHELIGEILTVGHISVRVLSMIGEGGYAYVYAVEEVSERRTPYALKRLLSSDEDTKREIVKEIAALKQLGQSGSKHIVQFVAASNRALKSSMEEFLVLTEFCRGGVLSEIIRKRSCSFGCETVAQIFHQILKAVEVVHTFDPSEPLAHRDLKLENVLIGNAKDGDRVVLKLCDFGSCSTKTYEPDKAWSMKRRNEMEETLARFTTPMYRAPEMLDTWNNYPVNIAVDVWSLGCILFLLCYNFHPFQDESKLAILNGNFSLPTRQDEPHFMFNNLIKSMLTVDPRLRPSISQVRDELLKVANSYQFNLEIGPDLASDDIYGQSPATLETVTTTSTTLVSSLKGGAGLLMRNLKDSSKSVLQTLQQTISAKNLDFHCITSRLAAMSFPAEGFEAAYSNHIDDVRFIMEARHSSHYTIINLSERRYSSSRFPAGRLVNAGWKSKFVPSCEALYVTSIRALEYLKEHKDNVVVVHCLDGRSHTALLIASIILLSGLVECTDNALLLFAARRCDPILSRGQRRVLKDIERITVSAPGSHLVNHRCIKLQSMILEPVPAFTKSQDGCRPYVEIYQDGALVTSTLSDYQNLKLFSIPYDDDARIPLNLKVSGNVQIAVYHARQTFGGILAGKVTGILICILEFDIGTLILNERRCIRFPLDELDGTLPELKYPSNFTVIVNFQTDKDKVTVDLPRIPDSSHLLLFTSRHEHQETKSFLAKVCPRDAEETLNEVDKPPTPPLRLSSFEAVVPKKNDDLLLCDFNGIGDDIVAPETTKSNGFKDLQLNKNTFFHEIDNDNDLLSHAVPNSNIFHIPHVLSSPNLHSGCNDLNPILDDFFSQVSLETPLTTHSVHRSGSMANVDIGNSGSKCQVSAPNYNIRNVFISTNKGTAPPNRHHDFGDLLGDFSASSGLENGPKTIGQMKQTKELRQMDPIVAKVAVWREGKSLNIRALLSSLHTVMWPESNWVECPMSSLIQFNQVRLIYRKACLAVHPDKHVGTSHEILSKLIFIELNEAWAHFKNNSS